MLSENLSSKSLLIKVFLEFVSSVENYLLGQKEWLSGGKGTSFPQVCWSTSPRANPGKNTGAVDSLTKTPTGIVDYQD